MDAIPIRSAKDRNYVMIPVDMVEVVFSRQREKTQFKDNVRSIGAVGQLKPILVNKRNFAAKGKYELICGEGRLTAHKELGWKEIKADIILKATKVDGVYDRDPLRHADAVMYKKISFTDVLTNNLKVMDATAISMCRDNGLPLIVFNLQKAGNIRRVICGEAVGTVVGG